VLTSDDDQLIHAAYEQMKAKVQALAEKDKPPIVVQQTPPEVLAKLKALEDDLVRKEQTIFLP